MQPQLPNSLKLQTKGKQLKNRQQQNFDQRHKATNLKPLQKGDSVWLSDRKSKGTVIKICASRSYIVQTDDQATYRQNRKILLPLPPTQKVVEPRTSEQVTPDTAKLPCRPMVAIPCPSPRPTENTHQVTHTRSGCVSKPPDRY